MKCVLFEHFWIFIVEGCDCDESEVAENLIIILRVFSSMNFFHYFLRNVGASIVGVDICLAGFTDDKGNVSGE